MALIFKFDAVNYLAMAVFQRVFIFGILFILFGLNQTLGQSKIILDKQSAGGYCNNYFDLGEHGFALIFNKSKDVDEGTDKESNLQNNIYYYSKDLSKRANFKLTSNGQFTMYASKNNLFVVDRLSTKYVVKVLDYSGREISSKKFDIADIGLNQDLIHRIHFTDLGRMVFEVYDGLDQLHLFQIDLKGSQDAGLKEVDLQLPSNNPLESMNFQGNWKLITQTTGFYILAKKGSNADFDPNAIAYHIAFYDEEFNLFRELLLDNFLMKDIQMLGKEASISLNPVLQSFVVSCNILKAGKPAFMAAEYAMSADNNVLRLKWYKEFDLINNQKYQFILQDGISVPAPPIISHRGPKTYISLYKGRLNVNEEGLNQMVIIDAEGKTTMNAVQMGNFEQLNLDGFCVDNDNLYSRIKTMQVAAVLKPFCESQYVNVVDLDLDAYGNELVIILNYEIKKDQIIIHRFPKK
jgi:hypothetical protein